MPPRRRKSDGVVVYDGKEGKTFRIKFRDSSGSQVMETVGHERDGMTRAQAAKIRRARVAQVDRGWRRPDPETFATTVQEWLIAMKTEKSWQPSTEVQYVSVVARLNAWFGPMLFAQIRPSDVVAYKTAKLEQLSGASVSRDLSILHSVFAWGVITERVDRNPASGVPHPAVAKRKGNALSPVEVQALARSFDDEQARVVFLTLVLTAVRRSEAQALRWADVDLIENRLRVVDSKTESGERSVAISPTLAEELWQHRRSSPYRADRDRVFCHPQRGTVYAYTTFSGALRRAYASAGMVFPEGMRCMHDLRVTSITNDAIAGANPVALMAKAGHANMATTRRYLRLAGQVFPAEAAALEARILGIARPVEFDARELEHRSRSTNRSTRLSEPEPISQHSAPLGRAKNGSADLL
jgi:integrase